MHTIRTGIIYKVTHLSTQMCYIGQTYSTLERRKKYHLSAALNEENTKFHVALRQFGEHAFDWEILYCLCFVFLSFGILTGVL